MRETLNRGLTGDARLTPLGEAVEEFFGEPTAQLPVATHTLATHRLVEADIALATIAANSGAAGSTGAAGTSAGGDLLRDLAATRHSSTAQGNAAGGGRGSRVGSRSRSRSKPDSRLGAPVEVQLFEPSRRCCRRSASLVRDVVAGTQDR